MLLFFCANSHTQLIFYEQDINMHQGANFFFSQNLRPSTYLNYSYIISLIPKGDYFVTAQITWMHR